LGSERFREAHQRVVANLREEDVRAYVAELSDEQLDGVAGGVLAPTQLNLGPRGVYLTALGNALSMSFMIPVPPP
jgi:hypothetical protein